MIEQLLSGGFFEKYGILIILIVFLVFMLIFSATKRKKEAKIAEDFANNLKVGDKVKTYSGVYGKIISIKDTPSGKICVIETGEGKNVSYMAVDAYAIYNIETPVAEKKVEVVNDAKNQDEWKASNEEKAVETEIAEPEIADAKPVEEVKAKKTTRQRKPKESKEEGVDSEKIKEDKKK